MNTDPIGTAQELSDRILQEFYLSAAYDPKAARPADTVKAAIAFTLQSRIAEVGRLETALDDCVASLAAIRATAANPDEWALSAEHFSAVCLDSLKVARAALQRRPT